MFKKTLNEKQRRKRKKIVGMPENKKNNRESRSCNCHDFDMVFSCYDLTNFFKSANGKTSFLCCCPKWLWLVFGQQNIQILSFVFDLYVCLFVCLFVSYKSISQKRKICISTFFSKKGNINFYHLSYWILLSYLQLVIVVNNGFWPGRREGRRAGGGYPGAASGGRG